MLFPGRSSRGVGDRDVSSVQLFLFTSPSTSVRFLPYGSKGAHSVISQLTGSEYP